jgi:signal peptidase I
MRVPAHLGYRRRKPKAAMVAARSALRLVLATGLLYLVLTAFVVTSVRVGSVSMQPTLREGDLLFVAPLVYGARIPLTRARVPGFRAPARGDVVLLEAPQAARRGGIGRTADAVVRFFTLQLAGTYPDALSGGVSRLLVKRVVAVPGDTVRIDGYRAWVRLRDATEFKAEATLARRPYDPQVSASAPLSRDVPFGGTVDERVLGGGEYFVLGDNRADSSDSRSWGAVSMERIVGPVVLRYFPFKRIGRV